MRKVFEHPASHEVGLCESILTSNGIPAEIRNRGVSSLMGEIPFTEAYPELWVLKDEDYERAIALLQEYHRSVSEAAAGGDWVCLRCGESVPNTLDACSKSQTPRPARPEDPRATDGE